MKNKTFLLKWVLWAVAIGLVVIFVLIYCLTDVVPPRRLTAVRMSRIQRAITNFVQLNRRLPTTLLELPKNDLVEGDLKDAWGQPIIYSVDTNGVVTLASLGADGRAGGSNQDKDMTISFPTGDKTR